MDQGAETTFPETLRKWENDIVIIGAANPAGKVVQDSTTLFTPFDLQEASERMNNTNLPFIPVHLGHVTTSASGKPLDPAGQVIAAGVSPTNGKLYVAILLHKDTAMGQWAKEMYQGDGSVAPMQLSMGYYTVLIPEPADGAVPNFPHAGPKIVKEVSLVHVGDRPDTDIVKICKLRDFVTHTTLQNIPDYDFKKDNPDSTPLINGILRPRDRKSRNVLKSYEDSIEVNEKKDTKLLRPSDILKTDIFDGNMYTPQPKTWRNTVEEKGSYTSRRTAEVFRPEHHRPETFPRNSVPIRQQLFPALGIDMKTGKMETPRTSTPQASLIHMTASASMETSAPPAATPVQETPASSSNMDLDELNTKIDSLLTKMEDLKKTTQRPGTTNTFTQEQTSLPFEENLPPKPTAVSPEEYATAMGLKWAEMDEQQKSAWVATVNLYNRERMQRWEDDTKDYRKKAVSLQDEYQKLLPLLGDKALTSPELNQLNRFMASLPGANEDFTNGFAKVLSSFASSSSAAMKTASGVEDLYTLAKDLRNKVAEQKSEKDKLLSAHKSQLETLQRQMHEKEEELSRMKRVRVLGGGASSFPNRVSMSTAAPVLESQASASMKTPDEWNTIEGKIAADAYDKYCTAVNAKPNARDKAQLMTYYGGTGKHRLDRLVRISDIDIIEKYRQRVEARNPGFGNAASSY